MLLRDKVQDDQLRCQNTQAREKNRCIWPVHSAGMTHPSQRISKRAAMVEREKSSRTSLKGTNHSVYTRKRKYIRCFHRVHPDSCTVFAWTVFGPRVEFRRSRLVGVHPIFRKDHPSYRTANYSTCRPSLLSLLSVRQLNPRRAPPSNQTLERVHLRNRCVLPA